MTNAKLPKLILMGDTKRTHVAEAMAEFNRFVEGKALITASYSLDDCPGRLTAECNYAVVFGGDGTIIAAARTLGQTPIIGINVGKLGFLAEFNIDEFKNFFPAIVSGDVQTEKRMMLSCEICCKDTGDSKFHSTAINDIYITSGPPFRMIELKISVDNQSLAGCVSDGLIISTPTGSTAYNLSAGGPILSANMQAMVITAICPHSLSFRPIVINADKKVEVVGIAANRGTTLLIDGQIPCKLSMDDVVKIEKNEDDFLIVNNPARTQWDTLAAKLGWAKKPKYKKT